MRNGSTLRFSSNFESRSFLVGVSLTILLALLWFTPLSGELELKALDIFFNLEGGPEPHPGIVHIDIDDTSIDKIGRWPWDRYRHAQLVDTLSEAGASAVVFDVTFPDLQSPENDAPFVSACAISGRVFVGFNLEDAGAGFSVTSLPWYEKAGKILAGDIAMEPEKLSREIETPLDEVEKYITRIRESVIEELLRKRPELKDELSAAGGFERLAVIRIARKIKSEKILAEHSLSLENNTTVNSNLVAPFPSLAGAVRGMGFVSVRPDEDGVLRHIPLLRNYMSTSYPYLSLALLSSLEGLEISVVEGDIALGKGSKKTVIGTNKNGELLLDWTEKGAFERLPFAAVVQISDLRQTVLENLLQPALSETGLNSRLEETCSKIRELELLALSSGEPRNHADKIAELRKNRNDEMQRLISQLQRFVSSAKRRRLDENNERISEFDNLVKQVKKQLDKADRLLEKLRGLVSGKICIVGSTHTGSTDLHTTSRNTEVPGCMAHSALLSMYHAGSFPTEPWTWSSLLLLIAGGMLVSFISSRMTAFRSILLTLLAMVVFSALAYLVFSTTGAFIGYVSPVVAMTVTFAATAAYRRFSEEINKKRIRNIFQRQVGDKVAESLIRSGDEIKLGGEMRTATVYFSDLAGFSAISEQLSPTELVELLNEYFSEMCASIVEKYDGYLDKFEGDAILAVFGVPIQGENSARDACFSALENKAAIELLREKLKERGKPEVYQRIGLNTGEMVVGYLGSPQRHDYTVIGDAVNLGQRLEAANKLYGTSIIVSETTYKEARNFIEVRELDLVRVPGRKQPVRIYELAAKKNELAEEMLEAFQIFARALENYRKRCFGDSLSGFEKVLEFIPGDGPSLLYVQRCRSHIASAPPDNWECVHDVLIK